MNICRGRSRGNLLYARFGLEFHCGVYHNLKNALIDKRLGELFSETISLEIGQNLLYEHRTIIEKIDQALREIKSHTNIGYVNKEKLIKKLNSKNFLERHLSEVLVEQEKSLYSVEAIVLSTNFAKSAIKITNMKISS